MERNKSILTRNSPQGSKSSTTSKHKRRLPKESNIVLQSHNYHDLLYQVIDNGSIQSHSDLTVNERLHHARRKKEEFDRAKQDTTSVPNQFQKHYTNNLSQKNPKCDELFQKISTSLHSETFTRRDNKNHVHREEYNEEEKDDLIQVLKNKCKALQSLLRIADKIELKEETLSHINGCKQSTESAIYFAGMRIENYYTLLCQAWKKECFKAILALNLAQENVRVANSTVADYKTKLAGKERQCNERIQAMMKKIDKMKQENKHRKELYNARMNETEINVKNIRREKDEMMRARDKALKIKHRNELVMKKFIQWAKLFVTGYTCMNELSNHLGREGTLYTTSCSQDNKWNLKAAKEEEKGPAKALEHNMAAATSKLNKYIMRLTSASSQLKQIRVVLMFRDTQLRNREAALSAERAAWEEGLEIYDTTFPNNDLMMDGKDPNQGTHATISSTKQKMKKERKQNIGLPAEAEALMRGYFKQIDRTQNAGECGKVDILHLVMEFERDSRIAKFMNLWMGSQDWWEKSIEVLKNRIHSLVRKENPTKQNGTDNCKKSSITVTWGEFLLFFFPNAKMELDEHQNTNGIVPLSNLADDITLTASENMYDSSNLRDKSQKCNKECFSSHDYAHLELVLPPISCEAAKDHLPKLSRLSLKSLRKLVRRLCTERSWLMECMDRICNSYPRLCAAGIAFDLCKQKINPLVAQSRELENEIKRLKIEIEIMKKKLHEATTTIENDQQEIAKLCDKLSNEKSKVRTQIELEGKQKQAQKKFEDCQEELSRCKVLKINIEKALTEAEERLNGMMMEIKKREETLVTKMSEVTQINTKLENDLEENNVKLASKLEQASMLQEELAIVKAENEILKSRWKVHRERKAEMNEYRKELTPMDIEVMKNDKNTLMQYNMRCQRQKSRALNDMDTYFAQPDLIQEENIQLEESARKENNSKLNIELNESSDQSLTFSSEENRSRANKNNNFHARVNSLRALANCLLDDGINRL